MAYTKTNWRNGEVALSDTNMNHMEQGIYDAHETISNQQDTLDTLQDTLDTLQDTLETVINERVLAGKPIGTIEINTTGVNPSTYLGGTWVAWGSGRVPVGVNANDTDFNTSEKTGGLKTHSHTNPSTGSTVLNIDQIPAHTHSMNLSSERIGSGYEAIGRVYMGQTTETGSAGGGQGHNHTMGNTGASSSLQPYITCYMWKRTA
jgi:hypothetical protein